jgi:hypothetical protein
MEVAEREVSQALIDKHRDINVHHDWWESTYESFKEDMQAKGIQVDDIYFSGFSCQGDGACFEGRVCDWEKFLPTIGEGDNPVLMRFAKDTWSVSVSHSGHYYHENCTHFSMDMPNPDGEDDDWFIERFCIYTDPDDFRAKAELAVLRSVDYESIENTIVENFRSYMRDLYRQLEKEHDYLTSDEAVAETIRANDLFNDDDEDGE